MKDRYKFKVLDVCSMLKGEACGSGSGNCSFESLEEGADWLSRRTENWQPPLKPFTAYDVAVYALMKATLRCWENHINPKTLPQMITDPDNWHRRH